MSRNNEKSSGNTNPTPDVLKALEALARLPRPRPSDQAREKARASREATSVLPTPPLPLIAIFINTLII